MTKGFRFAAVVVLAAASMSADAFWGGPWNQLFDGWGDGGFGSQLSFGGQGEGRYGADGYPYSGYYGDAPSGTPAPALSKPHQMEREAVDRDAEDSARRDEMIRQMQAQRLFIERLAVQTGRPLRAPALSPPSSCLAQKDAPDQRTWGPLREELCRHQTGPRHGEMLKRVEEQRQAAEGRHAVLRKGGEEIRAGDPPAATVKSLGRVVSR